MENIILAGPILRRTTKNRVCVWLATSAPLQLQLTVMDTQETQLGQSRMDDANLQGVQLGKNLFVHLLQARPKDEAGYPDNTLMYYRLDKVVAGNRTPLFSNEELTKLTYGTHPCPSFFIPRKLKNLLHGSCRKPHGGFNSKSQLHMPDALSHGHTLMQESCNNLEQRPAILLLTGDQIYADDVAISLLAMLREKSQTLMGNESMPGINLPEVRLHGRKRELKAKNSGFSSGESENHLFTFGEFAAMYIYSFGNLPAWKPIFEWDQLQGKGIAIEEEDNAYKAWSAQNKPLLSFHKTLADIRRLLANVPTYMIFDDHDVTDDWNITGAWYDGVRASPLGRRIVSNALAASWGFQAWGNDPDNFDKDMILSITQQLNDTTNNDDIGERYDLHTWKHRGWGFSIPSDPPIIAMDSRTQRQYENKNYPAQLMDRYALDWLRVEWAKLKTGQSIDDSTCPVLIAATPVMGFSTVELLQRACLWFARWVESFSWIAIAERLLGMEGWFTGKVVDWLDAESWSSNTQGFINFMDTLSMKERMGLKHCVFLSGDVHYAFTAEASFERRASKLQCHQLTSSALSNEPGAKQSEFLERSGADKNGNETRRKWAFLSKDRWSTEVQLLTAEDSKLRVNPECNLGLVQFSDGLPTSHTLLTGNGKWVYRLKRTLR